MTAASCPSCATPAPAGNSFCGRCGQALGESATAQTAVVPAASPAPVGAPAAPAGPSAARRYRGPLWTGGIGTVLFVAGAGVATAIFSAIQIEAAPGILVDIFSPWIDDQVQGTVAEDVIDISGVDGGTDVSSLGLFALLGLVGGALVAALGLVLMVIGAAWGANRAMGTRRSGSVTIAAPPSPVVYPAPAFHTAAAPTYTQPPAPVPASRPSFTQAPPPTSAPQPGPPPDQPGARPSFTRPR